MSLSWRPLSQVDIEQVKSAMSAEPVRACALLDAFRLAEAGGFLHLLDMEVLKADDGIKAVVWYDNWLKPWVADSNWIEALAQRAAGRFETIQQMLGPADTLEGLATAWSLGQPRFQQRFHMFLQDRKRLQSGTAQGICRFATLDDLFVIAENEALMILGETGGNPVLQNAEAHILRIARGISEQRYYVLDVDGHIVFQAALDSFGTGWGELAYFYTPEASRRKGYALEALMRIGDRLLDQHPLLFSRVRIDNEASLALFARAGAIRMNWQFLETSWTS